MEETGKMLDQSCASIFDTALEEQVCELHPDVLPTTLLWLIAAGATFGSKYAAAREQHARPIFLLFKLQHYGIMHLHGSVQRGISCKSLARSL